MSLFGSFLTSPFEIMGEKPSDMATFSSMVGAGDIFYIVRVIFFIMAIISLLCSFAGLAFVSKAQMVSQKKEKIKRILVLVAVVSFSVIGFNILKSMMDHFYGYYTTVHHYY